MLMYTQGKKPIVVRLDFSVLWEYSYNVFIVTDN